MSAEAAVEDKVVIVTGGTGHIGKGVCRALTKAGWTVIAVDLQEAPDADYAARVITGDLTQPAACEAAVAEVIRDFGGVDALVNMAQKVVIGVPFTELTDEHMVSSFSSGPLATMRMMQLCYPSMKARGGGSIVNFASVGGTNGSVGYGAYAAAKEAIRGITKIGSLEFGPDNVRVNVICPVAYANKSGDAAKAAIPRTPMGRAGDPETDIGAAVVFLAGPTWITGRTIHVDGGYGSFR